VIIEVLMQDIHLVLFDIKVGARVVILALGGIIVKHTTWTELPGAFEALAWTIFMSDT
jgi:hypothetical protein